MYLIELSRMKMSEEQVCDELITWDLRYLFRRKGCFNEFTAMCSIIYLERDFQSFWPFTKVKPKMAEIEGTIRLQS